MEKQRKFDKKFRFRDPYFLFEHLLFNISAQKDHYKYNKYHPNSSSSELLKRKEFQNGGKLSGNLKHGAVTIQNRMVPRRPIIRMSPIQRKIKNVLHNTF